MWVEGCWVAGNSQNESTAVSRVSKRLSASDGCCQQRLALPLGLGAASTWAATEVRTERAPYKVPKGGRLARAMTSDITLRPIEAAKLIVSKGRNVCR